MGSACTLVLRITGGHVQPGYDMHAPSHTGPLPRRGLGSNLARMPTYEYVCRDCGHTFDTVQSIHDDALSRCPECAGSLRRVVAAVGVHFKGPGFYRTDSRSGAGAGKTKGAAAGTASDAGGAGSTDKAGDGRAGDGRAGDGKTGDGKTGADKSGVGKSGADKAGAASASGKDGAGTSKSSGSTGAVDKGGSRGSGA